MASSIPYAVGNMMELLETAFANAGHPEYMVYMGKPMPRYTAPITFEVKMVLGDQRPAELGINYKREEEYQIQCCLTSFAGDQNFLNRMTEVYAAMEYVSVAIANDPSLTGIPNTSQNAFPASTGGVGHSAVRFAQIKNEQFYCTANGTGQSLGCIEFDVHCEARIESLT